MTWLERLVAWFRRRFRPQVRACARWRLRFWGAVESFAYWRRFRALIDVQRP
jgi:hypothetical protein